MVRYIILILGLAVTSSGLVMAQAFITPVEQIPSGEGSYVLLKDGTRLEGKIKTVMMINSYVKSLNFVTGDGVKHKFKSDEIERLGAKLGKLAKFMLVTNSLGNDPGTPWGRAMAFRNVDWEEIINREYAIYDQAMIADTGNRRLLQLLNPGFNSRLEVYPHFRKVTTIANANKITTYLVVKDESDAFVVKKKNYAKQFDSIFGDCESFQDYPGKPRFEDFAGHVFIYDQTCTSEGGA